MDQIRVVTPAKGTYRLTMQVGYENGHAHMEPLDLKNFVTAMAIHNGGFVTADGGFACLVSFTDDSGEFGWLKVDSVSAPTVVQLQKVKPVDGEFSKPEGSTFQQAAFFVSRILHALWKENTEPATDVLDVLMKVADIANDPQKVLWSQIYYRLEREGTNTWRLVLIDDSWVPITERGPQLVEDRQTIAVWATEYVASYGEDRGLERMLAVNNSGYAI